MIELDTEALAEIQKEQLPPGMVKIANDVVSEWEAQSALALNDEEKPHLASTIQQRLEKERTNYNERDMLQLVRAFTDSINNIVLRSDSAKREVTEAIKRLGEAYEEYESVEKIS